MYYRYIHLVPKRFIYIYTSILLCFYFIQNFLFFFILTFRSQVSPVSFIIEERETRNLSSVSNYRSRTVIGSLAQSQIGSNILCTHALPLFYAQYEKIKLKCSFNTSFENSDLFLFLNCY